MLGVSLQAGDILAWHVNHEHATGERTSDFARMIDSVDVHYARHDPERIDKTFADNVGVAKHYAVVKNANQEAIKRLRREERLTRAKFATPLVDQSEPPADS